jgi:hypothetical protein
MNTFFDSLFYAFIWFLLPGIVASMVFGCLARSLRGESFFGRGMLFACCLSLSVYILWSVAIIWNPGFPFGSTWRIAGFTAGVFVLALTAALISFRRSRPGGAGLCRSVWMEKSSGYAGGICILLLWVGWLVVLQIKYYPTGAFGAVSAVFALASAVIYALPVREKEPRIKLNSGTKGEWIVLGAAAALTILIVTFPMGLNPAWSTEASGCLVQYREFAERLLQGHISFDYPVDPALAAMENPYDYYAREALNVDYPWDRVLFNGHYYMYFGIVPVLLLFAPFRLITGSGLPEYVATAIFCVFLIIGLFLLFRKFAAKYFPNLRLGVFCVLTGCLGIAGVLYAVKYPSLYCTALTGGIMLGIWGLYFWITAERDGNLSPWRLCLGSLCMALIFGCRPPVGFAMFLAIPLFWKHVKAGRLLSKRSIGRTLCFVLPFVVVAALLMAYNHARFGSFFEFGQSYQLTSADQQNYPDFANLSVAAFLQVFEAAFLQFKGFVGSFPYYATDSGIFVLFPICLTCTMLLSAKLVKALKRNGLLPVCIALALIVIVIFTMDTIWSPFFLPRYQMDYLWLIAILAFIVAGQLLELADVTERRRIERLLVIASILTLASCFLYFFVKGDFSITEIRPDFVESVRRVVEFWKP